MSINITQKIVIGVTGGIGSGKTTIANFFSDLGVDIVDADIAARTVVEPGSIALAKISHHFGLQCIQPDGTLNRPLLRSQIFSNEQDKHWLNNLLHPLIRQTMLEEIQQSQSPYCLLVAPLLIENNLQDLVARILVIDIKESEQVKRAASRDPSSVDEIKRIIASQISREKRLTYADDIINNSESDLSIIKSDVIRLDQKYRNLASN
ncbi:MULTISPECIES: dephospho-CoA kinase [unclassified Colwellia]|uniref:dephospho-CoA kinase n=1 Tax=unclassified Colwellia TaxID=196834 RepID=UPI0015F5D555|nr:MULTISPECIES: dephospho-CoA kinase [unclassified Colwellia]MBA6233268.1 dephospho-CoA kinase [Colwellia sp. MB02u-7]MBA6236358.1 dephospho-CoA kinase [Colwellia sp. MB02u-11]MBA6256892.1 dephospho-CoA kinase [Colwellia sp. MB3u-28]MBA6261102.1 dephospho-CoA kinase [Colwellia sp. MB3u-41]MBA6298242.1 dephospho-CoA kinase [Colwellia sp. MB3u-22]